MGDYSEGQKALENLRPTYNFIFGRRTPIQNISGRPKNFRNRKEEIYQVFFIIS